MRYPSIDRLLHSPQAQGWLEQFPRQQVVDKLRLAVDEARQGGRPSQAEDLLHRAEALLRQASRPSLVSVINATGVLLHTNLGRSPLSRRALQHVAELGAGYCNLELDLDSGLRGQRDRHLHKLLHLLTGCQASLAVNNCAAAMLLIVDEFARGREVLVSRGELVEIGGSFRIPDLLQRGGARLVEVGTTNRTYTRDFERALTPESGMILSTHLSNFAQMGFVHQPAPAELVALARQREILSVLDLGSGLLDQRELPDRMEEPNIRGSLAQGWDLIAFSGDKLLGCAQAGFILGRADLIQRLSGNPWMRALRLDKLRLAALQGGLLDHLLSPQDIPLRSMLSQSSEDLKKRAQKLARKLPGAEVRACRSSIGGGSTPGQELESWAVCLPGSEERARQLRQGDPAVLTRIQHNKIWLDVRTILPEQEKALLSVL
ncbi:MAG: L-seryl-tRNA(Sec) selenium transferase [Candidatus Eremiobacteraeota bacterium]|nr:L-seryl-tRNA(Sec) selenium transferase [Candidatus Eremiobacteraeota bacterium]MCW5870260.1 L-seryl-tRNA(Sec) selenium transferase [Candidatus Eremiobacteraeota bacterium]